MRDERGGPFRRHDPRALRGRPFDRDFGDLRDFRGGPRGRRRRGDIRTAVLAVLDEQPRHGYDVIQALEAKSDGAWRPSAGSVYPMLQQLEDEGLARSTERDGKRVYELTDRGTEEAKTRLADADTPPWEERDPRGGGLKMSAMQLMAAAAQVGRAGTPEQVTQVDTILSDARKAIYRILAE
jgi:DNA-binding PadR family transcriptional regulator